ncbi:MAG: response regulator transcription factor [Rhodobacteraceae bacterium]|nr:response regulator transcription factor [Paracoccaceae bacterium]MCF8513151.1 response regulator transcription factor [Paracoccaceae bacterium]MCF8517395.1 response regulator transcription factor [Paracoccaceae bacterium]
MRMLLADDHDLFRESVAAMILSSGAAEVVSVSDLEAALVRIEQGGLDLVILDYQMPGMNGLEGLERAIRAQNAVPVAIISGTTRRELAEAAMARGAAGFVPKTMGVQALIAAVRVMAEGGSFVPLALLDASPAHGPALNELTRREMQVLQGLCEGKSNKEIARDLDVHEVTIKLHVKTLSRKLGAKNRTHAAMIARSEGLGAI